MVLVRTYGTCAMNAAQVYALKMTFFLFCISRAKHIVTKQMSFSNEQQLAPIVFGITIDVAEFTVSRFGHLLYLHVLGGG